DKICKKKNSKGEERVEETDRAWEKDTKYIYVVHRHNYNGTDVWYEYEYHENGKAKTAYAFIPK
ncbi:MAG: hypothetical protein IIT45_01595, partial [Treponema sp.]|nr:hypothetical protein [Treponema sp.]